LHQHIDTTEGRLPEILHQTNKIIPLNCSYLKTIMAYLKIPPVLATLKIVRHLFLLITIYHPLFLRKAIHLLANNIISHKILYPVLK
jgi:hypothetical protein